MAKVSKKRAAAKKPAKPDPAPSSSSRKRKAEASSAKSDSKKPKRDGKQLKKMEKAERLQHAMQSFLWWDAEEPPEGCQWRTMEHAGVSFPEPYVPHGVKMMYDGKEVDLTPAQEEA